MLSLHPGRLPDLPHSAAALHSETFHREQAVGLFEMYDICL